MKFLWGLLKDWGIALGAALVAFALYNWLVVRPPKSEGPAPAFELPSLDGAAVSLAALDAEADVVVLNFWFTTCPPCRHEIPELAAFHDMRPDVPIVGISVDRNVPDARLAATSKRLGINYPVLLDPDARVAGAYGVQMFPTTVLVRDGEIVDLRIGEVTRGSLAEMVDRATTGR